MNLNSALQQHILLFCFTVIIIYQVYNYTLYKVLLMPKIIEPRRSTKSLTVEEYWQTKKKHQTAPRRINYREEQAANRFRYSKPTEQAKEFNPLSYTLRVRRTLTQPQAQSHLLTLQSEQEQSHVSQYMDSIRHWVSLPLTPIKQYLRTRTPQQLPFIYTTLFSHLECPDAWPLLHALMRDCPNLPIWLDEGLRCIAHPALYAKVFNQKAFTLLFDTLCILMQTHYHQIALHIQGFFTAIHTYFFTHPNKYIRQYSFQTLSYLLKEQDIFWTIIAFFISTQQLSTTQIVAQLLFYRFQNIKSCLTAQGMTDLIATLSHLPSAIQSPQKCIQVTSSFLTLLFSKLLCQGTEEDILFDLNSVFKAVSCLGDKINPLCVINALSQYNFLNKHPIMMHPNNPSLKENILLQSAFITQHPIITPNAMRLFGYLLCCNAPIDGVIVQHCKSLTLEYTECICAVAYSWEYPLSYNTIQVLILVCKETIARYLRTEYNTMAYNTVIYRLVLIMKANNFHHLIGIDSLQVQQQVLVRALSSIRQPTFYVVYVRMIAYMDCKYTKTDIKCIEDGFHCMMAPYQHQLQVLLKEQGGGNYSGFLKQTVVYSHHEIKCLAPLFNSVQVYCQLMGRLQGDCDVCPIWVQLMMNRVMGSVVNLNLLQSRQREVRWRVLRSIAVGEASQAVIDTLLEIDSSQIDIDRERQTKRCLVVLQRILLRYIRVQLSEEDVYVVEVVVKWSMGFAFVGFKLIENEFIEMMRVLLRVREQVVVNVVMSLLQYYNYRHSRAYVPPDLSGVLHEYGQLEDYLRRDFNIKDLESAEWIGLERIGKAVGGAHTNQYSCLGSRLQVMVEAYFKEEFNRSRREIMEGVGGNETVLMPVEQRYLKVILSMCPYSIRPSFECLFFVRGEVLVHPTIRKIKKHPWQNLWNKRRGQDNSTVVKFVEMSGEQCQLYVHYLWKDILQGNNQKRRIIVEHIRDNIPNALPILFDIYFRSLYVDDCVGDPTVIGSKRQVLQRRFSLMHPRSLLNRMYILKTLLKSLKRFITDYIPSVVQIILTLQMFLYKSNQTEEKKNEVIEEEQDEVMEEEQDEVIEVYNGKQNHWQVYRNHRKELFKLLDVLFTHHAMEKETFERMIQYLSRTLSPRLMQVATRVSVPGLLKVWHTVMTTHSSNAVVNAITLEYIAAILKKDSNQKLANNKCIEMVLEMLLIILGIKEGQYTFMDVQEDNTTIYTNKQSILDGLFDLISQGYRQNTDLFKIILKLFCNCNSNELHSKWQPLLLKQLSIVAKKKFCKDEDRLDTIIGIVMEYFTKIPSTSLTFLKRIISLLPQIQAQPQRQSINTLIRSKELQLSLSPHVLSLVNQMICITKTGLRTEINYESYFGAITAYSTLPCTPLQHRLIIFNTLTFLHHQELSVRKAAQSACQTLLSVLNIDQYQEEQLLSDILGALVQKLRRPKLPSNTFWTLIATVGFFITFLIRNNRAYREYSPLVQSQFFSAITSISQSQQLKGIRMLKQLFQHGKQLPQDSAFPNAIQSFFLPILYFFILHEAEAKEGNLTSTLAMVSLDAVQSAAKCCKESILKKELKRLIAKVKFQDTSHQLIRVITQLIEGITSLEKCTGKIRSSIQLHGFDHFHSIIAEQSKLAVRDKIIQRPNKDIYFSNLQQLQQGEAVERNFINFQKKLLAEEQEGQEQPIEIFLRHYILSPLKTMLYMQSQTKRSEEKGKIFLTVAISKILVRFPMNVFLREFHKVLSKLGKLLKSKWLDTREDARKCLAQILQVVGVEMLYAIIMELKFHLRDNFQPHIFNYTVFCLLKECPEGNIDYCLPLILPMIVDQIFGKLATEKNMVDSNEVPTLNMESKKKKGYQLLSLVSKRISPQKVAFLITFLEEHLRQYFTTEDNLIKYDIFVNSIVNGIGNNPNSNAGSKATFIRVLHEAITRLKPHLKQASFEQPTHETTIREKQNKIKKVNKEFALSLQQQAGMNKSIFKQQSFSISQRRNAQIINNCLLQFYLQLLNLLLKKRIIQVEQCGVQATVQLRQLFEFVVECTEQRDNRIVSVCLKIIHACLKWSMMSNLHKKIFRIVLSLVQKMTNTDEQLLRSSFTILNDMFNGLDLTPAMIESLSAVIRLHTNEEQLLEQPYELLKTVTYKAYNIGCRGLDQLHELVKVQLIHCTNAKVRQHCKYAYGVYLRGQVAFPRNYKRRIGEEIQYLVNNLNENGIILELMLECIRYRSRGQLEEYGELMAFSLVTAMANTIQEGKQFYQRCRVVLGSLLENVETSKIVEKCSVLFAAGNAKVRLCGALLLQTLSQGNKIKGLQKYYERLVGYIEEECSNIVQNSTRRKIDSEWANIIQGIQEEKEGEIEEKKYVWYTINSLMNTFGQNNQYTSNKQFIKLVWKMCQSESDELVESALRIIVKCTNLCNVLQNDIFYDQTKLFSFKRTLGSLMRKTIDIHLLQQLINKLLFEQSDRVQFMKERQKTILSSCTSMLIRSIQKGLNRPILNQKTLPRYYFLLNNTVLSPSYRAKVQVMFWNKLLPLTNQINKNQNINNEVKLLNEETTEILKGHLGIAEYFRLLARTESERNSLKMKKKNAIAQLAVTDQKAFIEAKRNPRVMKQQIGTKRVKLS